MPVVWHEDRPRQTKVVVVLLPIVVARPDRREQFFCSSVVQGGSLLSLVRMNRQAPFAKPCPVLPGGGQRRGGPAGGARTVTHSFSRLLSCKLQMYSYLPTYLPSRWWAAALRRGRWRTRACWRRRTPSSGCACSSLPPPPSAPATWRSPGPCSKPCRLAVVCHCRLQQCRWSVGVKFGAGFQHSGPAAPTACPPGARAHRQSSCS